MNCEPVNRILRLSAFVLLALTDQSSAAQILGTPDACTYYGNSGDDLARVIVLDDSGQVIIAGNTNSASLPGTGASPGAGDIFIAKFDANAENLLAATLIGGSGTDIVYDLALDSSGNIFIAGRTSSADYPLTFGAYKTALTSPSEVFITRLNSSLTLIEASTLVGPVISDNVYGKVSMAIDSQQSVYIASSTDDTLYPSTAGAVQETLAGSTDGVISKLSSDLSALLASTYLGGAGHDYALALGLHNGELYVGGRTVSSDFPVTPADTLEGNADAFIARLTDDLQLVEAARFLGGSDPDEITAIAPAAAGGLYAAGNTYSDGVFNAGFQDSLTGSQDGFVTHLSSSLSIQHQTYLGGTLHDDFDAMVIGDDGALYVAGQTTSDDFPKTWQGFDQVYTNGEGFVSVLSADLASMLAGGYAGGNQGDRVFDLAQSGSTLYACGWTQSDTFWQTPAAFDTAANGGADAFVLRTGSLTSAVTPPVNVNVDAEVRGDRLWFSLPEACPVIVEIYSSDGRLAARDNPGTLSAGAHALSLPMLSSAVYSIVIRAAAAQQGLLWIR